MKVSAGQCFPLGATIVDGGVNFCVFSKHATAFDLVLFPSPQIEQTQIVHLDPQVHRTYFYWHVFVPGVREGQQYGYRAHGPYRPWEGQRFDEQKLLLDPYTRAVVGWESYDRSGACNAGDNLDTALRSVVVDTSGYDWEGDAPLRRSFAESIIYELHVGGFTRHPNSGVEASKRGTFAGLKEKIPYLKELGITAVELMPIHEFDPSGDRDGLKNYWGYDTVAYMAPHHGYCTNNDPVSGISELRDLVKHLHKAGIEVILDVVFNHTAEGNQCGPTQSFRGLDNQVYYLLDNNDRSGYANYSGCGNSFNANHPVTGRLILDALRYWVAELHVDGFRFDLAAALARDVFGNPVSLPPLLWTIESDPLLAGTKLIAEAWDAAGLYRVGWFVNESNWYAEWNGPFRDDVRRFVKGDGNTVTSLASRVIGSSDIYTRADLEPNRSINFVTCHDGFTLRDLVSFNNKHNDNNGENNRDGSNANFSWNCGVEGSAEDPLIEALRLRQMKNLLTILLIAQGTPMMLMGDEVGRSQNGNNNAYCLDDQSTWFDWSALETNKDLHSFVRRLIKFVQSREVFRQTKPIVVANAGSETHVTFHGVKLGQPDWSADSHSLAFTLVQPQHKEQVHVLLNAYWEPLVFQLPKLPKGMVWMCISDSAQTVQSESGQEMITREPTYTAMARSSVLLYAVEDPPAQATSKIVN